MNERERNEDENECQEWEDMPEGRDEEAICKYCGMDRVGKWLSCDRCGDWVCYRCAGVKKLREIREIFKMTSKNRGILFGCSECRREMRRVMDRKDMDKKAKRMLKKNRGLRLKVYKLEQVNERMGKMIIRGMRKVKDEEKDNGILYEKNWKLRTENIEKDRKIMELEERMFEEKIAAQRWAERQVKSKEIEVKR